MTTKIEFRGEDGKTFSALREAEKWAENQGYHYGPLCSPLPVGLSRAGPLPKWKNLTVEQRATLHGRIESQDFRNGPVTVYIED